MVAAALVLSMVAIAWASGLTVAELGLARGTWVRGLRWAAVPAAVVVLACALVLVVPALEHRVAPATGSWAGVAVRVLVGLPLLTVIPEELAFRGVTWALLRRAGGTRVATIGSSALFGLWHVLAALGGGPANETAAGALGEGAVAGWRPASPARWARSPSSPGWCSPACAPAAGACWRRSACTGR